MIIEINLIMIYNYTSVNLLTFFVQKNVMIGK